MIFDKLEGCSIEACKEMIHNDEFTFTSAMHTYQNEAYILAFEKFLLHIIQKENGKKIHTYTIKERDTINRMSFLADTLVVLDENKKNEKIELKFAEQQVLHDYNDAISPFLELLRGENKTEKKRAKTEVLIIIVSVLLLSALGYYCYLNYFAHIKEGMFNIHLIQTLPIALVSGAGLLQVVLLFKNYLAEKTILLYNFLIFIISLPQLFLFSSYAGAEVEIGKGDIFNYYIIFIGILCIPVFIAIASYFLRKRVVPLALKKNTGGVVAIGVTTVLMLFMAMCISPVLELEIGDYYSFLYYFCMIGLFITIAFGIAVRGENKLPHLTLSILLGVLAFSLAFPTSLNSSLIYPYKIAPEKETSSYQEKKEKKVYWFGSTEVASVQTIGTREYIDGYEVDDSDTQNRLFVKSIQSVKVKSGNMYELELTYSGNIGSRFDKIQTREIWKKNHETKKMEYVKPAMRDERPVVSAAETRTGSYRYLIVIPIDGTSEDLYHGILPKKQVGENTITLEKCHFPDDNNACVTLRDKSGGVIVGGIDYASEESKMTNQIIGYIDGGKDRDTYRYQFNDDGTYTYTKVDNEEVGKCSPTFSADEVAGREKLTQSQMDILKKDCTYKGNNQVHTVILNNQKEESVLLFNNDGKFLVENAEDTYIGVDGIYLLKYVEYTKGKSSKKSYYYYYAKYNTQFTEDTVFSARKLNRYVYWNNKEYFFRSKMSDAGDGREEYEKNDLIAKLYTLYDQSGNPVDKK